MARTAGTPGTGVGSSLPPRTIRNVPPRSVTSMSPFGSQAMLQGFFKPSTTVTTLNFSPGGPGGCARVTLLKPRAAAAHMIPKRRFDVVFMTGYLG